MFDPMEFLYIAQKLYRESDQLDSGAARTCINRAYYAAHLVVREKYKIKDDGAGSHVAVIKYFTKKTALQGNRLGELFMKRKDADYKLESNLESPITKRDSGTAISKAEEILKFLGKEVQK